MTELKNLQEWTHEGRPEINRYAMPGFPVGNGPWNDEPDKRHWIDAETDMDCLMVRGPSGSWCGYVAVTEDHPLFGKDYDDAPVLVHGGLTFANECRESERGEGYGVCHQPLDGRSDRVWWFGFDTAHAGDLTPMDVSMELRDPELARFKAYDIYRDTEYVENEVQHLARQLKALS